MAELLVILSCLAVLAQRTMQRVLVASLYSGLCLAHMLLDMYYKEFTDMQYYAVAGVFCVVLCQAIFYFTKQTRFTDGMITVSLCSFTANLYGWTLYYFGMDPLSYVAVSCAVLLGGLYVLLRKDEANESYRYGGLGLLRGPFTRFGAVYGEFYKEARA